MTKKITKPIKKIVKPVKDILGGKPKHPVGEPVQQGPTVDNTRQNLSPEQILAERKKKNRQYLQSRTLKSRNSGYKSSLLYDSNLSETIG